MNIPDIAAGLTGTSQTVVDESNLATALGSGTVAVFGTPAMVALMEEAAVSALSSVLPADLTSVGIYLEIHHLAATPPGIAVQATAIVKEVDGRVVTFELNASDGAEPIGRGIHRRVIVDQARFLQRAQEKLDSH